MMAEGQYNNTMVLVVEDNRSIAKTIGLYLQDAGIPFKHCVTAEQAHLLLFNDTVNMVLLDIMLTGQDGFWLLDQISQHHPIPVIMLTARSTEDDIIAGLEHGAIDYITKPFQPRELIARVKTHLRYAQRTVQANQKTLKVGNISIQTESMQAYRQNQALKLTKTEYDLLYSLMSRAGMVTTRSQLIEQVFGYQYEGSDRSIDTHLYNLRKKVEHTPQRPEYIHTIHGIGFRFEYRQHQTQDIHEDQK